MRTIFLFLITLCPIASFAQSPKPFQIIGTYNLNPIKEIRIYEALFDSALNNFSLKSNSIDIQKNKFVVNGTVNYPMPFQFSYLIEKERRVVASDLLFIEGGNIDIILKNFTEDNNVVITSKSSVNLEYQKLRALYKDLEVSGISGIQEKDVEKRDKILESYVKTNPGSYVAMWILIVDYSHSGYSPLIDSISLFFSNEVKDTKTFKTFEKRLNIDRSLKTGNNFPFDRLSFGENLKNTVQSSSYTLIDFWASFCKPCIAQFPQLRESYLKMHSKGFDIYMISQDNNYNVTRMESLIKTEKITWKNILDLNGKESAKLNVYGIPKNFLLDGKGKIVAEDISPYALEIFLKENMKDDLHSNPKSKAIIIGIVVIGLLFSIYFIVKTANGVSRKKVTFND